MIQNLNISTPRICVTMSTYKLPVIYFYFYIKTRNKVYNRTCMATFDVDAYNVCNVKCFMTKSFSSHRLRL